MWPVFIEGNQGGVFTIFKKSNDENYLLKFISTK